LNNIASGLPASQQRLAPTAIILRSSCHVGTLSGQPLIASRQQCAERLKKHLRFSSPMSVDELKAKGNALFSAGNYDEAIGWFTKAIDAGGNHVLYSNRSACYCGLRKYEDALADVRFA
jgi:tetratricopeptide (TPR) repeat protein